MKSYLVDTNVFLRFLLKDNKKHYQKAKKYFIQAKLGLIKLILIPEVVIEIDYVLRGVYSLNKKDSVEIIDKLVKSPSLKVKQREILTKSIDKYEKVNIDLTDLFLYYTAKKEKAEILSLDKDFKEIQE